jgi:hypothetical protein
MLYVVEVGDTVVSATDSDVPWPFCAVKVFLGPKG